MFGIDRHEYDIERAIARIELAAELGPFGITVNSAAPGFMPTSPDYVRQWEGYSADRQKQIVESIALRRIGKPEDIAHAVMFLASEESSFITGMEHVIDGGMTAC